MLENDFKNNLTPREAREKKCIILCYVLRKNIGQVLS